LYLTKHEGEAVVDGHLAFANNSENSSRKRPRIIRVFFIFLGRMFKELN